MYHGMKIKHDEYRKETEAATTDYLQRKTKPCPKMCMADSNEIRTKGNKSHRPSCHLYA
ncbi:hypothetical protein Glove_406g43 [Diversispora epigaea]|uniref:Uncharacterized protein n=1 Tax=Diversispora epigaea TaxID=1348612 RepID=A0A397H3Q7_9GLOM|nr:hypothetical protein Glove_406g43 [Diversispora epigaea]